MADGAGTDAEEGGDLFGADSLAQPQQGGEAVVPACVQLQAAELVEFLPRQGIQGEAGLGGPGAFPRQRLFLIRCFSVATSAMGQYHGHTDSELLPPDRRRLPWSQVSHANARHE